MDEMVLPSYEYPENWVNPVLDQRYALDRARFEAFVDDYYRCQRWDVVTGQPTRERLVELGVAEMYEPMVEGAARAVDQLPKVPPAEPVPLIHG